MIKDNWRAVCSCVHPTSDLKRGFIVALNKLTKSIFGKYPLSLDIT